MALSGNDVVVRQLQEQLAEFDMQLKAANGKGKKTRSCLNVLAEKLCDGQYGENQLGGPNAMLGLSDIELRDFILQNVLNQRVRLTASIKELQKLYLSEQSEKDKISQMMLDAQQQRDRLQDAYNLQQKQIEEYQRDLYTKDATIEMLQNDLKKAQKNAGQKPEKKPEGKQQNKPVEMIEEKPVVKPQLASGVAPVISTPISPSGKKGGEKTEGKNTLIYMDGTPYDINQEYAKCNVYQIEIIRLMGTTGHNEIKDILADCRQDTRFGNDTTTRNMIDEMVTNKLLDVTSISTPIRKRVNLYSLSELGKAIFLKENKKKPVKDEMTRTKEMHATLPHGYCIRDVVQILTDIGYTNVCMDSSKNSVEIAGGKRYIPDITAYFEVTKKTYWEVELGHHHDADMFDKLEKASKVTDTLYIVTNDNKARDVLVSQVQKFKQKLRKENRILKMTVYVGTMTMLSKRAAYFDNPQTVFKLS